MLRQLDTDVHMYVVRDDNMSDGSTPVYDAFTLHLIYFRSFTNLITKLFLTMYIIIDLLHFIYCLTMYFLITLHFTGSE